LSQSSSKSSSKRPSANDKDHDEDYDKDRVQTLWLRPKAAPCITHYAMSNTDHYWSLGRQSIWHPYTKHSALDGDPFPTITRGEGIHLYDTDGNRYVDAISSWWACNLGHSHPRLVEAIRRQAGELQHSILGNLSHPRAIELASKLVELFPDRGRRVLFASDGASAVEAALRVAVQYWHNVGRPERCRFAALAEGYHGDTLGAMNVGYLPTFHAPYRPILNPAYQAEAPCCAACKHDLTPDTCDVQCFVSMQAIIEEHAAELAAVIVEPLCQGAAGMRIYSPAYLNKLGQACRKHEILLIVDEIAMGFGRTGRMFAFEHAGLDPDIVCLGKSLSGGMLPMSAAVVKEGIFQTFADEPEDNTFYHGHTFAGNPIAAAAALACLEVYEEQGIVARAEQMGRLLAEHFMAIGNLPDVANVRCLGMVAACELAGESGAARAQMVRRALLAHGVLLRPLGNVVYLMLPLVANEHDLIQCTGAVREAVAGC